MNNYIWRCIVCEQKIAFDPYGPGDDEKGLLPCLEGGTLDIHFGWFSRFDQLEEMMSNRDIRIQGSICDNCYQKKMHLTRKVEVRTRNRYVPKPNNI